MSTFCITGSSNQDIKLLESVLKEFGVEKANPSSQNKNITMEYWHNALADYKPPEKSPAETSINIGEFWKELAINIFLANQGQRNWCWAEPSSLPIMEFWKKLDHKIVFILVYTPLKRFLQTIIHDKNSANSLSTLEEVYQWKSMNEQMESFYKKNNQSCLIISMDDIASNFNEFSKLLKDKWGLKFSEKKPDALLTSSHPPVSTQVTDTIYRNITELEEFESRISHLCYKLKAKASKKKADGIAILSKNNGVQKNKEKSKKDFSKLLQETTGVLHKLQEDYTINFFEKENLKEKLIFQENRLTFILKQNPKAYEFESLTVTELEETTNWHFKNIYISNKLIPNLKFQLTTVNHVAGIIFERDSKDDITLIPAWPHPYIDSNILDCTPVPGNVSQGSNMTLSSIGTEGWSSLIELVTLIKKLTDQKFEAIPEAINDQSFSDAINNLQATFSKWPTVLRYDHVDILDTVDNGPYQRLSLSLKNISVGTYNFEKLTYNFSSYNSEHEEFGTHPRLEFPVSSKEAFDNWFEESAGAHGSRLELRFAHPDMMDTNVIYKLSEKDQILMFGLISSLERQIEESRQKFGYDPDAFTKWVNLAKSIKVIASKAIAG